MKHFPLALVALLVAGALWLLLGTDERGPGARASAVQAGAPVPTAPVELLAAEKADGPATQSAEPEPPATSSRVALGPVEDEAGARQSARSTGFPASVRVVVVHAPTGDPIPGLIVIVWAKEVDVAIEGPKTNRSGSATRRKVPPGVRLDLVVQSADGSRELHRAELEPLEPSEQRVLTVALDEIPGDSYWFRVVSRADGAPVAGARLLDCASPVGLPRSGREELAPLGVTDGAGLVKLQIRSQHDSLIVEADGFAPGLAHLAGGGLSANTPEELRLSAPARLDVQLVDEGGAHVAGRKIVVHRPHLSEDEDGRYVPAGPYPASTFHFEATTDAAGLARFEGLPTLAPVDNAFSGNGTPLQVSLLGVGAGERSEPIEPGAFQDLVPGSLELDPGEHRKLVVPLGGGTLVHGVAVDQHGSPVADLELWLLRAGPVARSMAWEAMGLPVERKARTDAVGRFDLERVPIGSWELLAASSLDVLDSSSPSELSVLNPEELAAAVVASGLAFEVDGRQSALELTLRAVRGLIIEGSVLDAEGDPAIGEAVAAFSMQPRHVAQTLTGEAGAFRVGPLLDVEYELYAGMTPGAAIRARPGERVTLHLTQPGELHGFLVGEPDRLPVPVHTSCLPAPTGAGIGLTFGQTTTPEFQFESLAPGEYSLSASTSDGRFAAASGLRVEPGRTTGPVPLRLEPGGRVGVTAALSPASNCLVVLRTGPAPVSCRFGTTQETYELLGPPGPAVVELWIDQELRASREVVLTVGEDVEVEFREP